MNKGDMVEIVDIDKKDKWLVRNKKNLNQVCVFFSSYNEKTIRTTLLNLNRSVTFLLIILKCFQILMQVQL